MKKTVFLMAALFVFGVYAQEKEVLSEQNFETVKWFKNPACKKLDGGGDHELVTGGQKGRCLKITTNSKQIFMLNLSKGIPVRDGAKIRIELTAKGKGTIGLVPMGITDKGESVYLNDEGKEKINADNWEKIPFIIRFKDQKGRNLTMFKMRLNFEKNSVLFVDNFKVTEVK